MTATEMMRLLYQEDYVDLATTLQHDLVVFLGNRSLFTGSIVMLTFNLLRIEDQMDCIFCHHGGCGEGDQGASPGRQVGVDVHEAQGCGQGMTPGRQVGVHRDEALEGDQVVKNPGYHDCFLPLVGGGGDVQDEEQMSDGKLVPL